MTYCTVVVLMLIEGYRGNGHFLPLFREFGVVGPFMMILLGHSILFHSRKLPEIAQKYSGTVTDLGPKKKEKIHVSGEINMLFVE